MRERCVQEPSAQIARRDGAVEGSLAPEVLDVIGNGQRVRQNVGRFEMGWNLRSDDVGYV